MPFPSDHYTRIYSSQAAAYHQLISAEDVDGNLLPALQRIASLEHARLLDLGSGTGRIPLLVQPYTTRITALDLYRDMLNQQSIQRSNTDAQWPLIQADMQQLPFRSTSFDIVTAGWAIGHFLSWYGLQAYSHITRVLNEMTRVAKPGGCLIILETLTTGGLTPAPPTKKLADYYTWLENEHGFTRQEIQTDYQFASLDAAVANTEFFFGPALSQNIRANNWTRLPEWTGLWSKTIPK